jgi:TrmH family RNA methyltransferase
MMNQRLKRYKKDFGHSYCFGVFPTLELLVHRPQDVLKVLVHPKGEGNEGVAKIRVICQENGIQLEIQEKAFSHIGARENDYAAGIFRKVEPGLDQAANHVILVNPSGMGNLGTIIRTMLGFGFGDLAIIEPAADIYHPETVRGSMGALFQMRFQRFENFEAYRDAYPRNFYPLMTDGVIPLPEESFAPAFGLIFGNESSGLGSEYQEVGTSVSIPQNKAIDSLNLAVAVGVTLYQVSIQERGSLEEPRS